VNTIINANPGFPVTLYDTGSPDIAVLLKVGAEHPGRYHAWFNR
jgi:hypothetical protein